MECWGLPVILFSYKQNINLYKLQRSIYTSQVHKYTKYILVVILVYILCSRGQVALEAAREPHEAGVIGPLDPGKLNCFCIILRVIIISLQVILSMIIVGMLATIAISIATISISTSCRSLLGVFNTFCQPTPKCCLR